MNNPPFNNFQNTFPPISYPFPIVHGMMEDVPRSILRLRIPPGKLAKFGTVIENLTAAYHFNEVVWEDKFIEWINIYSKFYHSAVHLSMNANILLLNGGMHHQLQPEESRRVYYRFVDDYKRQIGQEGSFTAPEEMPSFEDLWDEAIRLCEEYDHASPVVNRTACKLCEDYLVHGQELAGRLAYAFSFACCLSLQDQFDYVVRNIMDRLPDYTHRLSDFPNAYVVAGTPEFRFPVLTDATDIIHSRGETALMTFFGPILALTVDTFERTNYTPSVAQIEVLQGECEHAWIVMLHNDYDPPFSLRIFMASANLLGIVDFLVHKCRQILQLPRSPHTLGWALHLWFFMLLQEALLQGNRDREWAHEVIAIASNGQFDPDVYSEPIEHYRHQTFTDYSMEIPLEELEEMNQELEDVGFESDGPPLDPLQYVTLVTEYNKQELCVICQCDLDDDSVVKLPACNHLLHLECVRTMINGTQANSNLCPLDRTEICPRRARRVEEEEEEVEEEVVVVVDSEEDGEEWGIFQFTN